MTHLVKTDDFGGTAFRSEGKMFEVIPIITLANGQPLMLPPAIWHVDNWLFGMDDGLALASPMNFYLNQRQIIPGSNSAAPSDFQFLVRIMEDGEPPSGVVAGHIDAAAVVQLLDAIRTSPREIRS